MKLFVLSSDAPALKDNGGSKAFPTQTEAKTLASQLRKEGYDSEIETVNTPEGLGARETACALYNKDGWVGEVIATIKLDGIKKNRPKE